LFPVIVNSTKPTHARDTTARRGEVVADLRDLFFHFVDLDNQPYLALVEFLDQQEQVSSLHRATSPILLQHPLGRIEVAPTEIQIEM
jgi:hypothetical protein